MKPLCLAGKPVRWAVETSVVSLCLVDNGASLVLGGSCDAASRQLFGEDVAYVLPIIIWQFSANFRTGLIYGCICMMYIFLSYWFLLFFFLLHSRKPVIGNEADVSAANSMMILPIQPKMMPSCRSKVA